MKIVLSIFFFFTKFTLFEKFMEPDIIISDIRSYRNLIKSIKDFIAILLDFFVK